MLTAPNNIFVTGATGFLGSHFLRQWLRTQPGHVFALTRATNKLSVTARIAAALQAAQQANNTPDDPLPQNWTALEGDITHPLAGLHPEALAPLRATPHRHLLALRLRPPLRGHATTPPPSRINVDGARHTLALAAALNVKPLRLYLDSLRLRPPGRSHPGNPHPARPRNSATATKPSKAEAEHLLHRRM